MTMITPSYLGETIEYSSLHACRSTLEDPTDWSRLGERSVGSWRARPAAARLTMKTWSWSEMETSHDQFILLVLGTVFAARRKQPADSPSRWLELRFTAVAIDGRDEIDAELAVSPSCSCQFRLAIKSDEPLSIATVRSDSAATWSHRRDHRMTFPAWFVRRRSRRGARSDRGRSGARGDFSEVVRLDQSVPGRNDKPACSALRAD